MIFLNQNKKFIFVNNGHIVLMNLFINLKYKYNKNKLNIKVNIIL